MRQLFDPGLQPERTQLAWRRTVLSLTVGALVAVRLLPHTLGPWALAVGLVGLALATVAWVLAARRGRQTQRALLVDDRPLPGGGLLLLVTVLVSVGAAVGLADACLRRW